MYRIRIIALLGLLLFMSAVQAQSPLSFNLTGTITPGACQITVPDVNLGTYLATQFTGNYATTPVNVPVTIQQCGPLVTRVRMTFSGVADANNSNLFKGVDGIGIELLSAIGNTINPAGTTPVDFTPVSGGGTYTFRARFRQSKATVAAGTVNLPVVITVTYS